MAQAAAPAAATSDAPVEWVRSDPNARDPAWAAATAAAAPGDETRIPPGTYIPYCLREQMRAKGYEFCEGPRDGPGGKVMIDGFVAGLGMVPGVGLHEVHPLTAYAKGHGPAVPIPSEKGEPVNGK